MILVACKKEDRIVTYGVTCEYCSAGYEDMEGRYQYIKITPDTTYTETDTIIDRGPFHWEVTFSAPNDTPNERLDFSVSRLSVVGHPTTAWRIIDGAKEEQTAAQGDTDFYLVFH